MEQIKRSLSRSLKRLQKYRNKSKLRSNKRKKKYIRTNKKKGGSSVGPKGKANLFGIEMPDFLFSENSKSDNDLKNYVIFNIDKQKDYYDKFTVTPINTFLGNLTRLIPPKYNLGHPVEVEVEGKKGRFFVGEVIGPFKKLSDPLYYDDKFYCRYYSENCSIVKFVMHSNLKKKTPPYSTAFIRVKKEYLPKHLQYIDKNNIKDPYVIKALEQNDKVRSSKSSKSKSSRSGNRSRSSKSIKDKRKSRKKI